LTGSTLVTRNAATSGRTNLNLCDTFFSSSNDICLLLIEPSLVRLNPWKSIGLLIHAVEKFLDALIPIAQL
jgi:hypothetical protein